MAIEQVERVVRGELDVYKEKYAFWRQDHAAAMLYFDVCDVVEAGLQIFTRLNRIDEEYRQESLAGTGEYDPVVTDTLRDLYRHWSETTRLVVESFIPWAENNYDDVEATDRLRSAFREVAGILTPDSEFFVGEEIVDLRDSAIDEARAE